MSAPETNPPATLPPGGDPPGITRAFVLAAGLGKRMRPVTATLPKPLVPVAGKTLLDHALDRAAEGGITHAVVNVHWLPDLIEAHLARRSGAPEIAVSDERAALLETGGGVRKALDRIGPDPFVVFNADSFWLEGPVPNLPRLIARWDPAAMDILLLVAPAATSLGYEGKGDFVMDPDGRLERRGEREVAPFIYAGVAILKPELFADTPEGSFSLNLLFDRAIARERLHGLRLDGQWLHVGTPEAIQAAEERVRLSAQAP
ncbi:nucleotidyltransferase family protein [Methylobacterium oxalidis]|uniref:Mannose-1-phosphate guanylyltransferase n=1 Tax=Methylobacterium oxalidis TaxID=944322 RepID=A0A512J0Q3_9HYPH|nr:nucleotidyltransferase family protein [Methylobacterium oxalidis]GEP03560.1 mannose-1-phosphate guanylyltransferase [Methylobacterium oxalidis]GJE33084.1 N-acetylmuramate alpha-1-phosphate uridylyltransferase [Methylobacterium oxalidis]GLS66521.1 mannose-1-phosphate guanylyltransferase [Methylobacterium oxalidis]